MLTIFLVIQIPALLVGYWMASAAQRLMLILGLEASGILVAVVRIEAGYNYYLWNAVALLLAGRFAWDLRRFQGRPSRHERLAMRQLFGDTLPQLMFRDSRRISFWRKPL